MPSKVLTVPKKTIAKKAVASKTVAKKSAVTRGRDPWDSDADRHRDVNAHSPRARRRWLSRTRGWLQ